MFGDNREITLDWDNFLTPGLTVQRLCKKKPKKRLRKALGKHKPRSKSKPANASVHTTPESVVLAKEPQPETQ